MWAEIERYKKTMGRREDGEKEEGKGCGGRKQEVKSISTRARDASR